MAVSGGADSVALLVLMSELRKEHGFEVVVLHFDHGIRKDSVDDAEFVRRLAKRFGLQFRMARVKVERRKGRNIAANLIKMLFVFIINLQYYPFWTYRTSKLPWEAR